MATLTKAEIANRVLEHLGVKPASQNASAADAVKAQEAVESTYRQLRYEAKAPFDLATVPEWAWLPLTHYVAGKLVDAYGIAGERLMSIRGAAAEGYRELCKQTAGKPDPARRTRPYWF